MKVCQNPQCHLYNTTDRLRGSKGKKYYQSRKASKFYYGNGHFCTLKCQDDFWGMYADRIIQYIGLIDIPFTRPVESESRYDLRSRIADAVQEETLVFYSNVEPVVSSAGTTAVVAASDF